jgi:hypothetical protein
MSPEFTCWGIAKNDSFFERGKKCTMGTYFGGEEADYVNHLFIDSDHQLLFCGQTASSASISTSGAFVLVT